MALANGHWVFEAFKELMTTKEWRTTLLARGNRTIIFRGTLRTLKAKSLGAGVYEISKTPIKE